MPHTTLLHKLPVETALQSIGEQLAEQESATRALASGVEGIKNALEKMNERIQRHDEFRARFSKILTLILAPIAVALIIYLAKITWIVQVNRIPGAN